MTIILAVPTTKDRNSNGAMVAGARALRGLKLYTPRRLHPMFSVVGPRLACALPTCRATYNVTSVVTRVVRHCFAGAPSIRVDSQLYRNALATVVGRTCQIGRRPSGCTTHTGVV